MERAARRSPAAGQDSQPPRHQRFEHHLYALRAPYRIFALTQMPDPMHLPPYTETRMASTVLRSTHSTASTWKHRQTRCIISCRSPRDGMTSQTADPETRASRPLSAYPTCVRSGIQSRMVMSLENSLAGAIRRPQLALSKACLPVIQFNRSFAAQARHRRPFRSRWWRLAAGQ